MSPMEIIDLTSNLCVCLCVCVWGGFISYFENPVIEDTRNVYVLIFNITEGIYWVSPLLRYTSKTLLIVLLLYFISVHSN